MSENDSTAGVTFWAVEDARGETVAEIALPPGSRLVRGAETPRAHTLGEACDVEDHTPCDVNVSVGYAQELVEAEGLSVPAFDRLVAEGWDTTADVVEALRAVQSAAPEANQAELAEVIGYVQAAGTGTP